MERELRIGMHLVFIDSHRKERDALLTEIHGDPQGRILAYEHDENGKAILTDGKYTVDEENSSAAGEQWPCINLVVVSDNDSAKDQYGRQIDERFTSIVHMDGSTAIGFCFRFPDEEVDWSKVQSTIS